MNFGIYIGIPIKGKLNFDMYTCMYHNIELFDYITDKKIHTDSSHNTICGIKISSCFMYKQLFNDFDECKYYCKICGFDNLIVTPSDNNNNDDKFVGNKQRCNKCDFRMDNSYFYNINFICENLKHYGNLDLLPLYFDLIICRDVENFIHSKYLDKYLDALSNILDFIRNFSLKTLNNSPYFFYKSEMK